MKLFTLGTSSCAVNPTRFNSSALLQAGNNLYLFDAGSPCDALIVRAGHRLRDIRAIFITHMHLDHIGGLPNLIRAISMEKSDPAESPVIIYLPEASGYQALQQWLSCTHAVINDRLFEFKVISSEDPNIYQDENISVTVFPTDHIPTTPTVTYAYGVYSSRGNILFTGDLSADLHDMPDTAYKDQFDVCLCEATHYDPGLVYHLFQRFSCKRLILTHVHTTWQSDSGAAELLAFLDGLPYPLEIAFDGAEYRITPEE